MLLNRIRHQAVKLVCAAGLAAVMAGSVLVPATVEASNETGTLATGWFGGYIEDNGTWIYSTARGFAGWTSTLRCGYYYCNWYETPIQMEALLYDYQLMIQSCCGPLVSTRQMDLFDYNGHLYYSKVWGPSGALCWQSMWDPTNYDHFGGCNTGSYSLPYWGYPAGKGKYYIGISGNAPGGWGYTTGQFWLY